MLAIHWDNWDNLIEIDPVELICSRFKRLEHVVIVMEHWETSPDGDGRMSVACDRGAASRGADESSVRGPLMYAQDSFLEPRTGLEHFEDVKAEIERYISGAKQNYSHVPQVVVKVLARSYVEM
jgi:hypothetical protein